MIKWEEAEVIKVLRTEERCQVVRVRNDSGEAETAWNDTGVQPVLEAGDRVLLNTTAVRLGLGTGGVHFVAARLGRADDGSAADCGLPVDSGKVDLTAPSGNGLFLPAGTAAAPAGHIVKLRYTPMQRTVLAAEEPASPYHELFRERLRLDGMPVLIGDVHSMLPAVCAWLRHAEGGPVRGGEDTPDRRPPVQEPLRLAYVMGDGGALPLAFSRHAAVLRRLGWIIGTVTYGHAYGGDLETVNKFTGLLAARHILQADAAIAVMGPGIAGTGTPLGHTGMEAGELVNATARLGGVPVVVPRVSFADPRERHRGLSAHTLHALTEAAWARAVVPLPGVLAESRRRELARQLAEAGIDRAHDVVWMPGPVLADVAESLTAYPEPVTTMGRSVKEDPAFFAAAAAAAEYVRQLCRCGKRNP